MRLSTMTRWRGLLPLLLLAGTACGPGVPCGDLVDSSPALAEVCADGVLDCSEHGTRNQYNYCPSTPPAPGPDERGVTWTRDLFLDFLPNPYHPGAQCWRGASADLGVSSYQCCYEAGQLLVEGELAGSFDFVDPLRSVGAALVHFALDIWPWWACECP